MAKSIIKQKEVLAKATLSLRVSPDLAQRLKAVRKRIRALPEIEGDIDQRIEESIVRLVKQAEKELDALAKDSGKKPVAVAEA